MLPKDEAVSTGQNCRESSIRDLTEKEERLQKSVGELPEKVEERSHSGNRFFQVEFPDREPS